MTGDLSIADLHDIENNFASEVHVKRFKSKDLGIKILQEAFIFPCTDFSLRQEGHAQRQTSRHQRVESLDAGGVPSSVGEARGDPVRSARSVSLHEEGGVADFSEADRDPLSASEDFCSMSGKFIHRHHVMPREEWYVWTESSFPTPFEIH